ncbi:hypothetical protein N9L68_03810 [bacterium]|nr:hypothetical protein [bacterium]
MRIVNSIRLRCSPSFDSVAAPRNESGQPRTRNKFGANPEEEGADGELPRPKAPDAERGLATADSTFFYGQ